MPRSHSSSKTKTGVLGEGRGGKAGKQGGLSEKETRGAGGWGRCATLASKAGSVSDQPDSCNQPEEAHAQHFEKVGM